MAAWEINTISLTLLENYSVHLTNIYSAPTICQGLFLGVMKSTINFFFFFKKVSLAVWLRDEVMEVQGGSSAWSVEEVGRTFSPAQGSGKASWKR